MFFRLGPMKGVDAKKAIRKTRALKPIESRSKPESSLRTVGRRTASEKELIPWPSVF